MMQEYGGPTYFDNMYSKYVPDASRTQKKSSELLFEYVQQMKTYGDLCGLIVFLLERKIWWSPDLYAFFVLAGQYRAVEYFALVSGVNVPFEVLSRMPYEFGVKIFGLSVREKLRNRNEISRKLAGVHSHAQKSAVLRELNARELAIFAAMPDDVAFATLANDHVCAH